MSEFETLERVEVNGVSLCFAVQGEGRPVVLLHGNGEDHHLFDMEIRQLTQAGYQVFAPDSRGHGANPPVEEYHYADMAEDIYQFIQAMALERPALYGHSDGGIIALLLELMHPGTLGLMAISGTNLSPAGLRQDFLEDCARENEADPQPLVTLMLTEPDIDPNALESIAIPVLITAGEFDLVLPEETWTIADHIPQAEPVFLPGEDHGSYLAGSPIMGELLLEFFREHDY